MWLLTVLMGDHINGVFYEEMYGRFAGLKKSSCNNEVTVFTKVTVRLGSTVMKYEKVRIVNHCYAFFFFHCIRFNQTKSPRDQVAMDEIEDRLRRKVRISSIFYFFYFVNGVLFYVY